MKNKLREALGIAIAGATLLSAAAASAQTMASLPRGSLPAAVTGEARPVMAWVDFCRRHPQECAVDTAEAPVVALSPRIWQQRSEEHTSELQSHSDLVCRLLLEKKKQYEHHPRHQTTQPKTPKHNQQ